jgi:TonB family protein
MRTTRAIELLAAAAAILALAAPVPADPDVGDAPEPGITDSPTERIPAITAFPGYPAIAQRDRIEGEATVCFRIAPDGRILDPAIESSTHRIFEKPALEAIRESSFEPLAPGQELSGSASCRTYRFRLDPLNAAAAGPLPRVLASSFFSSVRM